MVITGKGNSLPPIINLIIWQTAKLRRYNKHSRHLKIGEEILGDPMQEKQSSTNHKPDDMASENNTGNITGSGHLSITSLENCTRNDIRHTVLLHSCT